MKLEKPKLFKNLFSIYNDERGFLSSLDVQLLLKKIQNQFFDINYQVISHNLRKNTFRGMHFQSPPFEQNKLIVLHKGSIIDLTVKIENAKIENVLSYEMSAGDAIYIPKNYAHGYLTTTDNVLMQYFMDEEYSQISYKGINCNKYLEKKFPNLNLIISDKDKNLKELLF